MANIACAFTLREIERLNTVLDSLVCYFSIEFLPNTPSGKPRVAFRLKTLHAEEDQHRKAGHPPIYRVCRISMVHTHSRKGEIEIELLPDVKGETECLAAGVPAFDLSADAMAAFYFRVNYPPIKLGQWLDILEGRRRSLYGSDLTYFKFTRGNDLGRSTVLNGCRDFMCQAFVRLHVSHAIESYTVDGPPRFHGGEESKMLIDYLPRLTGKLCFSDIIAKRFSPADPEGYINGTHFQLCVDDFPIQKGLFGEASRVDWIQMGTKTIRLPYMESYDSESLPSRDNNAPRRKGNKTNQSAAATASPGIVRRSSPGGPASSTSSNAGNRTGERPRKPASKIPCPISKIDTGSLPPPQATSAKVTTEAPKTPDDRTGCTTASRSSASKCVKQKKIV